MKTETHLKLTLERALEAFKNGTKDQKQWLIDMYGKEHFLIDIKDRVIDYQSACVELNISPLTRNHFNFLPEEDQERAWNRHQLTIVTRALRGDWKPNFKDGSYNYYNYFYWNSSENGFSSRVYSFYCSTFVGSDLMFPNKELADHARKICEKQYIAYHF